ncbi:Uncharacterised protein [Shigella sonnei]|nr:hypothetical protein BvCmsKSNP073_01206 [Escherichia coli]CSI00505.1 Uncharacterised protein [Shigella sonnei]CSQ45979.1 Uncharacterised protein [Shigella sonnei]
MVVQPSGSTCLSQIEEHLVGGKALMLSIQPPGDLPAVHQLAVQSQFHAVLVGILL